MKEGAGLGRLLIALAAAAVMVPVATAAADGPAGGHGAGHVAVVSAHLASDGAHPRHGERDSSGHGGGRDASDHGDGRDSSDHGDGRGPSGHGGGHDASGHGGGHDASDDGKHRATASGDDPGTAHPHAANAGGTASAAPTAPAASPAGARRAQPTVEPLVPPAHIAVQASTTAPSSHVAQPPLPAPALRPVAVQSLWDRVAVTPRSAFDLVAGAPVTPVLAATVVLFCVVAPLVRRRSASKRRAELEE